MSGSSVNRGVDSGEGPYGAEDATNVVDEHVLVLVVLIVLDVRLGTGRSNIGLSVDLLLCLCGSKADLLRLDLGSDTLVADTRRPPPGPLEAETVSVE